LLRQGLERGLAEPPLVVGAEEVVCTGQRRAAAQQGLAAAEPTAADGSRPMSRRTRFECAMTLA
jgi:hypothetical protein